MKDTMDILLIESSAKNAYVIQSMLEDSLKGSRKEWTYSLGDAVDLLGENTFDIILTNVMLSEGGGPEIIEQLIIRAPTTPIIALMNQGNWEVGKSLIAAGAQDFLIKDELSPALLRKSITYSIERQRLYEDIQTLTTKDDLTQLYNRRGFTTLAEHQLKLAERNKAPCTLLFIDLDNLKQINDSNGHPVGDMAICETADILRTVLRTSDIIGRLGGDEFVVLAPDTRNGNVEFIINRLTNEFEKRNTMVARYMLRASIGVVTYEESNYKELSTMIKEGCDAMYTKKNAKKQ